MVDTKYSFKIGDKNKRKNQIEESENAFVIKDGIDIGSGKAIPLWLFGFMY